MAYRWKTTSESETIYQANPFRVVYYNPFEERWIANLSNFHFLLQVLSRKERIVKKWAKQLDPSLKEFIEAAEACNDPGWARLNVNLTVKLLKEFSPEEILEDFKYDDKDNMLYELRARKILRDIPVDHDSPMDLIQTRSPKVRARVEEKIEQRLKQMLNVFIWSNHLGDDWRDQISFLPTPARRSLIWSISNQSFIDENTGEVCRFNRVQGQTFILDEEDQPITFDFEPVEVHPLARVTLIYINSETDPELAKRWQEYLADFKIVPVIDQFITPDDEVGL